MSNGGHRFLVILFLSVFSIADSSELCGLEPPKEGEECNAQGSVREDSPNTTELERKWDRELYVKASYTSEEEWPHKEILDEADDYIVHDAEKAIRLFNEVLQKIKSNRAIYARARTKEIHYFEREKSDPQVLKEILGDLMEILGDENAMFTIWRSAFFRIKSFYENQFDKFYKKDVELLEFLLYERRAQVMSSLSFTKVVSDLLENFYAQGQFEKGAETFERNMNLTKETKSTQTLSEYANFLYGITLRQIPQRKREGNKILRGIPNDKILTSMASTVEVFVGKCRKLHLMEDQIDNILKEASKLHVIGGLDQKPIELVEGVKNQPIWDLEIDMEITVHEEEINSLTENWSTIRNEVEGLMTDMSENWMPMQQIYNISGNWSEYPLFSFGKKRHFHCQGALETCKILKSFPASSTFKRGTIKFIVLQPRTRLTAFHGPSNAVLRAHLGLKVPPGQVEFLIGRKGKLDLEDGKVVIFDNSFDRTLINHSTQDPLVLLSFDLPNPDMSPDALDVSYTQDAQSYFIF